MSDEVATSNQMSSEYKANRLTFQTIWVFYIVGSIGLLALDISGVGATTSMVLYSALGVMLIPYAISTYVFYNYDANWVKYILIFTGFITVIITMFMTDRAPFLTALWALPLFLCILYNNQKLLIFFTVLANIFNIVTLFMIRPFDLTMNDVQGSIIGMIAISAVAIAVNRRGEQEARDVAAHLANILDKSRATASNVHESGQVIASHTSNLSDSIDNIASTANQLAVNLQNFTDRVNQISDFSQEVTDAVEKGQESKNNLLNSTTEINEVMDRIQNNMEAFTKQLEEINNIVVQIKDIAFQTRLLALNASVEAARAGETGRGFAVVAQEVNNLSEESTQLADQISDMVNKSNSLSVEARESVETGSSTIKNNNEMIQEMGSTLDNVLGKATDIAQNTQEVAETIKELSAGSENLAASVEEQTAATQELSARAQELLEEANYLEEELSSE